MAGKEIKVVNSQINLIEFNGLKFQVECYAFENGYSEMLIYQSKEKNSINIGAIKLTPISNP